MAFESRAQRIDVLLIADNTGDVRLIQETFRDANAAVHLFVAFDGVDAMAFLKHDTGYKGVPSPEDGRIRHWGEIIDQRDRVPRILRVVILEDGVTIHNAFFDRNVRKDQ